MDNILGQKTNFHKFKMNITIESMFTNHNGIELKINKRNKSEKSSNIWKVNNNFKNSRESKKSQRTLDNIFN